MRFGAPSSDRDVFKKPVRQGAPYAASSRARLCRRLDRRDPVAESELGEGQYYRLPARFVELSLGFDF